MMIGDFPTRPQSHQPDPTHPRLPSTLRRLSVMLCLCMTLSACGQSTPSEADPCAATPNAADCQEYVPTTVPVGQLNEYGQIRQQGRMSGEVVIIEGVHYHCMYLDREASSPQCFVAPPAAAK